MLAIQPPVNQDTFQYNTFFKHAAAGAVTAAASSIAIAALHLCAIEASNTGKITLEGIQKAHEELPPAYALIPLESILYATWIAGYSATAAIAAKIEAARGMEGILSPKDAAIATARHWVNTLSVGIIPVTEGAAEFFDANLETVCNGHFAALVTGAIVGAVTNSYPAWLATTIAATGIYSGIFATRS